MKKAKKAVRREAKAPERVDGKWKLVGFVGVDSGQVMICDPCYLPNRRLDMEEKYPDWKNDPEWFDGADKNDDELHDAKHVGEFSYRGVCSTTMYFGAGQLYYRKGHDGAGVSSCTMVGDGIYPVYAQFNAREGICALTIRFDIAKHDADIGKYDVPEQRAELIKRAKAIDAERERAHQKQMDSMRKGLEFAEGVEELLKKNKECPDNVTLDAGLKALLSQCAMPSDEPENCKACAPAKKSRRRT